MTNFRQVFITVVISLLLFSAVAYGDTWTTTKRLTNNAGYSVSPAIAVHGQNIYVVWSDDTPGNYEIYFRKSDDGGATGTTKRRLTNNTGSSAQPAIAVNGQNIYVVWNNDTSGNHEIYFKKSVDGGDTWTTEKRLISKAGHSVQPAIAVNGSSIYVVWSYGTEPDNYEIYFKKSDDGGATWTKNKRLIWNKGLSFTPAIAVDGSNIYVVWDDNKSGNYDIYFKKSVDGGDTWTKTEGLTNNTGHSYNSAIAVDGSNIYVVWVDETPGIPEIYFKKGIMF